MIIRSLTTPIAIRSLVAPIIHSILDGTNGLMAFDSLRVPMAINSLMTPMGVFISKDFKCGFKTNGTLCISKDCIRKDFCISKDLLARTADCQCSFKERWLLRPRLPGRQGLR